jgi:hypothetical protein
MGKTEPITNQLIVTNNEVNKESELTVLLEEYKSLREEVISLQEFTRQNITTIYAGIGLISVIAETLIKNNLQVVFLLFPFLFYSLALTSVKYALSGIHIGNYIKLELKPHIIKCLSQINPDNDYSHIFFWEQSKSFVKRYGLLLLPANSAHYWLPLLAAIFCIIAFFGFSVNITMYQSLNLSTIILLAINAVVFIYTMVVGLIAGYSR